MVTVEDIRAAKTKNGGFTKKTLEEWGVSWPPPKGWRYALENGLPIPTLGKKPKKTKNRKKLEKLRKQKPVKITSEKPKTKKTDEFYQSFEWKEVRYKVLVKYGPICMLCGWSKADGAKICVDHIKPIRKYPHLKLEISNLQILCDSCNRGKGYKHEDDFRDPLDIAFMDKMADDKA